MQQSVQTLEVTREEVKAKIELMEALDQLHRSPAFKKVILGKYLKDRPQELVKLMALPQNDQQKELVHNSMVGISALQAFFLSVYRDGEQAKEDLKEYDAMIAERVAEEQADV